MNDATYELVKRHIIWLSSGAADPLILITDEKLPEDFVIMHGREVHMGTVDVQDFNRRNFLESMNSDLPGHQAT